MGKYLQQLAEQTGQQVASGAAGGIMGLVLSGINDRRQLKQQERLQNLQMKGNKAMMDYSMSKELQMWKDTSYPAQMEMLKKAGLNPGLMYGMGGGGGQTIGSPTGAVEGGKAPQGGGEIPEMMGMGMQLAMMKSQKELVDAQAAEIRSRIPGNEKEPGLKEAQTNSLLQGIKNQKAQETLTNIQSGIQQLELRFLGDTMELRKSQVNYEVSKLNEEISILETQKDLDKKTATIKEGLLRAELANKVMDTYLKQAQKIKAGQEVVESITRVKMMIEENMREWDKMAQTNELINLKEMEIDWNQSGLPKGLQDLLDNIMIIPGLGKGGGYKPVTGFKTGG